ncbi:MAG: hypothetical protein RLY30_11 [Pseudomonadota bacterium]|jgi:hypothetical protein
MTEPKIAPIERYLADLQSAMAGRDPAVIHDALVDAEIHLRSSVRAGQSPEEAIRDYGTAAEVAQAYEELPARGSPRSSGRKRAPLPLLGIWAEPQAWLSLIYFLVPGFAMAIAGFVWVVTLGALSLGLLPVLAGLLVFVFLLGSSRVISIGHGLLLERFLGIRMPRRYQPVVVDTLIGEPARIGFIQRIWAWLKDGRSWLAVAFLFGNFFVATAIFVGIVVGLTFAIGLVALPFGYDETAQGFAHGFFLSGDFEIDEPVVARLMDWVVFSMQPTGEIYIDRWAQALGVIVGLVVFTVVLYLCKGLGLAYGMVVQAIQVSRPQAVARRYQYVPADPR